MHPLTAALFAVLVTAANVSVAQTLAPSLAPGAARPGEEVRTVSGFNAIKINGPIDITLKAGPVERVVVRADDQTPPLVETKTVGNELTISTIDRAWFRSRQRLYATVEFKELNSLELRGSGDVHADRIAGKQFNLSITGSGDVLIDSLQVETLAVSVSGSGDFKASEGRAAVQGYSIAGSGDIVADQVPGRLVAVRIAGSGDARVHATESLEVSIAGSGSVAYRGAPPALRKSIAGIGSVTQIK